ncbi:MAG TPA: hypothetical protein DCY79_00345 [Planctomycetaceae bacterium]|nr:hypothetical protein [Planctomycetaceae bacterium]
MPSKSISTALLTVLLLASGVLAETHWAYRPIRRSAIPTTTHRHATANAIDHFVIAQQTARGLQGTPPTTAANWIRRVSLDLIGIPPTPAEATRFVADSRPDADARLVDRLLASPHYGERWARPWLDLCHYADSDGYLTDQPRPVAWRYRAWLVEALNADLPFDQFTAQQLAGDLLPATSLQPRLATGFLRQTLSNREGGADPEEFRVKQVIDRTSMVGKVWMGLTVGCAECHDHKYDDLSQHEFYQLYAFFNQADEINLNAPLPHEAKPFHTALPAYQRQRQALLAPLNKPLAEFQSRWEHKLLTARDHPGRDWFWDRQWELLGLVWGGFLGEGQLEGWQIVTLAPERRTQLQRDRLLDYFLTVADSFDRDAAKKLKLGELRDALAKLKSTLPPVTRAPTMMETHTPRPTFVHEAGDFRLPGDEVQANTPGVLPQLPPGERNRRVLAEWLVSPQHPLTARVAVNRSWQEFFGAGIVATPGDFGVRGATPSHPRLLDWLASELMHRRWSTKQLHRTLVTSSTYRQQVASGAASDAERQRWLAGQRPLRLSAEQIRDSVLRVSGLWDARIGGPSVRPPQPASVSEQGYQNSWQVSSGGNRYRRSLYTWVQRTSPFAMHITFDAPNPNQICTRRERSNTPLQALTLLNGPFFFEAAGALAQQSANAEPDDERARIHYLYQRVLSRPPTVDELSVLLELINQLRADANSDADQDPWPVVCSVLLNLHEFVTRG